MKIELDTNNLSDLDRQLLIAVVETINTGKAPSAPATASVPAPAAPKPAPVEVPVAAEAPTSEEAGDTGSAAEAEDLLAPADPATPAPAGRTMSDAIAAATKLVSNQQSGKVKEALAAVGVKRVSEIPADAIEQFLTELGE